MFGHQDEPAQPAVTQQVTPTPVDSGYGSGTVPTQNPAFNPALPNDNYLLEASATDGQAGAPSVALPQATPTADVPAPSSVPVGGSDALIQLKQQALQQLSPLVGHLEQTPEEKFRTTMMMIQAADNQDLLQAAYDAANQIPDEKARAQALLDVINEINYFSQGQANA